MNLLEKTKTFFGVRNSKPHVRIERRPAKTICVLTTATSQKIDVALDDWVAYVRFISSQRIYACVGSTVQDYVVLTATQIKETGVEMATFNNIPSKILRVKGSRSLSFIVAANVSAWTSVELWGEDDL